MSIKRMQLTERLVTAAAVAPASPPPDGLDRGPSVSD